MYLLIKLLLTVLLTLFFKSLNSCIITDFTLQNSKQKLYDYYYNLCIDYLIKTEGFSEKVYKCPANYNTIGFGHLIKKTDKIDSVITYKQAISLLKSDFNECLEKVERLSINKRFACALFIFKLGIGTYNQIKNDFKSNVLKYCFYKKNDKYIFSQQLKNNRLFELIMYQ